MDIVSGFSNAMPTEDWLDRLSLLSVLVLILCALVTLGRLTLAADDIQRRSATSAVKFILFSLLAIGVSNAATYVTFRGNGNGSYTFLWYGYLLGFVSVPLAIFNSLFGTSKAERKTGADIRSGILLGSISEKSYDATLVEQAGELPVQFSMNFKSGELSINPLDEQPTTFNASEVSKVVYDHKASSRSARFHLIDKRKILVKFSSEKRVTAASPYKQNDLEDFKLHWEAFEDTKN